MYFLSQFIISAFNENGMMSIIFRWQQAPCRVYYLLPSFFARYLASQNKIYFPLIIAYCLTICHLIAIRDNMNIQNNNYDYLFKYIIVGDTNVGKSCLLLRFSEHTFKKDHEPTLGVQFTSKVVQLEGHAIKIQIWDTAGQESFKAITRSYYKGSIAAFLVFDVTNRASFQSLHKWLYEVKNHSHDKLQIFVLGNKNDLKSSRQVTFQEAETFARNNDFSYFDVSAYNGDRVEEVFLRMTEKVLRKIVSKQLNIQIDSTLGIRKGKKQKKEIINQNGKISLGMGSEPQSKCCK